ncbi:LysR family transcriptional regulator [Pediococcus ethanolidurans]|uniref:LysR family transcriptional regulator n=2 Tax=Pediococcus ethanolidurans TaxID=319653 RepID=A0A0R2K7V2_9LACO|nr:LysR family transcriptional regulator [Pediococcus ethanolidurans]
MLGSEIMIETYLLKELAVFLQTGTLAKTAEQLNVTQPTVTRGMQKLEDDFGVRLFDRQPNRITLTETGKLAAKEAVNLVQANQQMIDKIHNFDQSQRSLQIGSVIPGPLILLKNLVTPSPQNLQITSKLLSAVKTEQLISTNAYAGIISNQALATTTITSHYLGTEKLAVNLDKFMFQANQSTISFSELKDLSFVVLSDIGPWREIIQKEITDAKFLYQAQREAFAEITKYSDFPYFSTNLSAVDLSFTKLKNNDNRVLIPITDSSAQMKIYFNYLKEQKKRVAPVITYIQHNWPA